MDIYIKFDVIYDECNNNINILLKKVKRKSGVNLGSVELIKSESFKVRFWHSIQGIQLKTRVKMRKMLRSYFKYKNKNMSIKNICQELSKEQYNISDSRTRSLLKKYGIKIH